MQLNPPGQDKKWLTELSACQTEAKRIMEKYEVEELLKVEYVGVRKNGQYYWTHPIAVYWIAPFKTLTM